jgi:NAD(P)H-flavin reductase
MDSLEDPNAMSVPDDVLMPAPWRIVSRRDETPDGAVFTWQLQPEAGEVPPFRPGQFNMLYAFGVGEVPISISGDPEESGRVMHTLRAVGRVTRAMQTLQEGELVGVRGPFGTAWPLEAAFGRDLVLVAGGIGLAPLRPVVCYAMRHREAFRRVFLLIGCRDPASELFRDDVIAWSRRPHLVVEVIVDRGGPAWRGHVGVVTKLVQRGGFDPTDAVAFLCGPEAMMRYAVLALQKRGVSEDRIHISMERNMQCAVGTCGHCQWGRYILCRDGPVLRFDRATDLFDVREL